ncbi:S1C family serine protease [Halosimplex aquaticum]
MAGVVNSGGGDNIGFAISAPLVRRVIPALLEDGEYEHSYMGVRLETLGPRRAEAIGLDDRVGVYIALVRDGGPSDGVLQGNSGTTTIDGQSIETGGDVIVSMNETPIQTRQALASFLALETSPGDTIDVTVLRDGEEQTVELTLGSRPDPRT